VTPRRIRFVFRDQNRYTIGQMIFDLKPDRIPPMGRQRFRQRVDDPPQGAVAVDVAVDPME
ncbi:MAG: hypothetical protein JO055_05085, partial [Alphaproteobacteria bacterium]|nr:hypothetical protein [Alphaproteobacteria bacterium]